MSMEQPATQDSDVADNAASEDISQADNQNQDENLDHDSDSEEQTEEEEQDEIDVDGRKFALPKTAAEKLKAERLMQADYTRKTQELAEQRKQHEAQRETERKSQEKYIGELAKVKAIDDQLAAYRNVDWNQLIEQDPQRAVLYQQQQRELEMARNDAQAAVTQKQQELALNEQQEIAKQAQEAMAYVQREIPGWTEERDKQIAQYAKAQGLDMQNNLRFVISNPALLKVLHKAELYDRLEKKQSAKPAAAPPPKPVTKVSASQSAQRDPAKMSTAEWMAHRNSQVRKSNR